MRENPWITLTEIAGVNRIRVGNQLLHSFIHSFIHSSEVEAPRNYLLFEEVVRKREPVIERESQSGERENKLTTRNVSSVCLAVASKRAPVTYPSFSTSPPVSSFGQTTSCSPSLTEPNEFSQDETRSAQIRFLCSAFAVARSSSGPSSVPLSMFSWTLWSQTHGRTQELGGVQRVWFFFSVFI